MYKTLSYLYKEYEELGRDHTPPRKLSKDKLLEEIHVLKNLPVNGNNFGT